MTEIEILKDLLNYQGILKAKVRINASANSEIALGAITEAIEVIGQYRAIGTIEELQKAKEQYDDIHSVAEKTALCGLCDYATAKEAVITEIKRSLDCSLKEYQAIGTIEELQELKEENRFLDFLYGRILPNEMEQYLSMYNATDIKGNTET